MSKPSPFALVGARLIERGYAAVPVIPGTKRPGALKRGEWVGMTSWREEYSKRLPSRFEIQIWSQSAAGVGVVCSPASKHLVAIDLDTDDAEITSAVLHEIPPSTIIKKGAKGSTRFYIAPTIEKSKSWNINNNRICDLIGPGRFTVLPPTIHPDTGEPYTWIGLEALEDTDPDDLPELTPEHIEAVDAALAPFGFEHEPDRVWVDPSDSSDDASMHRRLNDAALANLDAWVPGLDLYRCRQTASGYEAVATWRESNTGRHPDIRKLNLKVHPLGINDFGDGPRKFTPLDLIMTARNCNLDAAFGYLAAALGWGMGRVINDKIK